MLAMFSILIDELWIFMVVVFGKEESYLHIILVIVNSAIFYYSKKLIYDQ